jgi:hypothetical protein
LQPESAARGVNPAQPMLLLFPIRAHGALASRGHRQHQRVEKCVGLKGLGVNRHTPSDLRIGDGLQRNLSLERHDRNVPRCRLGFEAPCRHPPVQPRQG